MPDNADLHEQPGKGQPAIELQLPATPFSYQGHDLRRGSPVQVHRRDGAVLEGQLLSLSLPQGRLSLRLRSGNDTAVDLEAVDYLRFGRALTPRNGNEELKRAVPFRVGLRSGRQLEGRTLGALRSDYGLTLFEQIGHRLYRLFIPVRSIDSEQLGEPDDSGGKPDVPLAEEPARALARRLGLHYLEPDEIHPDPEAVKRIPASVAREYTVIPLAMDGHRLRVATSNPVDPQMVNTIQFMANRPVEVAVASEDAVLARIAETYGDVFEELAIRELSDDSRGHGNEESAEALEKIGNEKPIVRLVNGMLMDAIRKRASDIHIRPTEDSVDILYRIDGMLLKSHSADRRLHRAIVSRIKILGHMDISERRVPQDGRLEVHHGDRKVDLRISIMPTVDGESVVIRLLDTSASIKSINQLGLSERDTERFNDLIGRNQGMFLVTGPTGSGKSTTLYAAIGAIRDRPVNIMTVEDPVEYHIGGVEQIQVNRAVDLTFPRALRNILRHDPDVIMIGEIRDEETARIAMKSALTGHLVLSTLHTNSAVKTIARLLDMGIERFLLQSTVTGILAQRLVRRNCPACSRPVQPDARQLKLLELDAHDPSPFHRGDGCDECNHTGYRGRTVTYELMVINDAIRQAIVHGEDEATLTALAVREGMVPLTEHVLSLARNGETSLEEVLRVRLD